ncbi:GNAT family N-acetyltransferase [Streptomyces sp. NPDC127098]|uniref:GNAT family N-acetyltransferase n=1 Tax=Streptomyces sp. NPDC127098 TaxID=3347137 RepID=UPI003669A68A
MMSLVIRALVEDDARSLFFSLTDPGLVGRAILDPPMNTYETVARGGEYRPEWSWVAVRDGQVVARAAFWGGPDDEVPRVLEWFDFTDRTAAVELLRTIPHRADYELLLPPDWRGDPTVRAAARARLDAAQEAGYHTPVERYHYLWTPECGLPERPGRLTFRPEPDDAAVLAMLRRVHEDSLDGHTSRSVATGGVALAAQEELDHLRWCASPRDWWRLAYTSDGQPVGFHAPVINQGMPVIGTIGVVPEQRGCGYGYDLLVEGTHQLVTEGAERIAASTDVENRPMAAAFTRAGYPILHHRHRLTPP